MPEAFFEATRKKRKSCTRRTFRKNWHNFLLADDHHWVGEDIPANEEQSSAQCESWHPALYAATP
eukprot:3874594-Karenia_brevis.AAC.1